MVDVYLSERRTIAAAQACFETTIDASTVTPTWVTSEKVTYNPQRLRVVLPTVEHRTSK